MPLDALPVRCQKCKRVRYAFGPDSQEWAWHPKKLRGEVMGMCRTCMDLLEKEQERERHCEGRRLERNRERGYGGPSPGEDVFRGFRGGK